MKIKKCIKILFFSFLTILVSSCDETEDVEIGETSLESASGDWYVQTSIDGEVVLDYAKITTANTAANNGTEIIIDDHKNIYYFKVKCPINPAELTFSGTDLASSVVDDNPDTPDVVETYDITVTISNGTIVKDGATSTGGNTVDQISFDAEFSDDPGTIYKFSGYKRTGFAEDEH